MGNRQLAIQYDAVGDILFVDLAPRRADQVTDWIEDELVARFNERTGLVENFDVLHFQRRVAAGETVALPLDAVLEPDHEPVPGS